MGIQSEPDSDINFSDQALLRPGDVAIFRGDYITPLVFPELETMGGNGLNPDEPAEMVVWLTDKEVLRAYPFATPRDIYTSTPKLELNPPPQSVELFHIKMENRWYTFLNASANDALNRAIGNTCNITDKFIPLHLLDHRSD